ncbi:hypothetical protein [Dechloromonas sp. A34]|uniref:hypothetical protein n=1 Tax=Dechloromonas sp. A34 TaxID=447588 RepID=UPI0022487CAA|nr:hypothetical protein [Dechloromonas sp. A34]
MSKLSQNDLSTLEESATTAAAYLDACDNGAKFVRLDPDYYQACGHLLQTIFAVTDASRTFPSLVRQSASAREMADSVEIGRRIDVSVLAYYPQLAALLKRISD